MPVRVNSSQKLANRARREITVITDLAQDDLLLAISCIEVSVDSDRRDLLLDCAQEYLRVLARKLKLASKIARSVPESGNGQPEEPK